MPYDARVVEVIIASPSDVADERKIVREVISGWNDLYSRERAVVLLPIGWDTHSSPELSGRPQQLINDRLLAKADLLVGIFWTRVGSPTGKAISGSVEEIEEHVKRGKPVMLYFSQVPVVPASVDNEQYAALNDFKNWASTQGLVETFESRDDFRNKFRSHLPRVLRDNSYLKERLAQKFDLEEAQLNSVDASPRKISEQAGQLLSMAAQADGVILVLAHLGGTLIQAGGKIVGEDNTPRTAARWKAAVEELSRNDLIDDPRGEGKYFNVTDAGYRTADSQS